MTGNVHHSAPEYTTTELWSAAAVPPLWLSQRRDASSVFQPVGPVIEEDTERAGLLLLHAGLEDFLAVRAEEGMEAMRLQRWVAQVCFEQAERLSDLIQISSGFAREREITRPTIAKS